MTMRRTTVLAGLLIGALTLGSGAAGGRTHAASPISHVLLISVDGLHASDLAYLNATYPISPLATLAGNGVVYPNASTAQPSDSFPGLLSILTGGSPRSTGVYYDDSYDRSLVAPVTLNGTPTGASCTPGASNVQGTEVRYDETVDADKSALNGGGTINPQALPRDPVTCAPVYPHAFLRVNTIFNVVKDNSVGRTAWADKHRSYDIVNGHQGGGVDDLYTPEIAAPITLSAGPLFYSPIVLPTTTAFGSGTDNVTATVGYDNLKVQAILNEIDGKDHTGTTTVGVPTIFGMNLQAVSVGEKAPTGGYDSAGQPTGDLVTAMVYIENVVGALVQELKSQGLYSSTLVIITAKHGQSPIARATLQTENTGVVAPESLITPTVAQATEDDIALLWLANQGDAPAAAAALHASLRSGNRAQIQTVYQGTNLIGQFGDPAQDPRVPDLIVNPVQGVIYTKSKAKIAEHGGFNHDDTSVALLVANPNLPNQGVSDATPVQTTQIASTILDELGLNPYALQSVSNPQEYTYSNPLLPSLGASPITPPTNGAPTPELGSGALLLTGVLPLAVLLVWRRKRSRA